MSRYVTGVSKELKEKCRTTMLNDNMDLSRLMVQAQQLENSLTNYSRLGYKMTEVVKSSQ